jgi:hypothetical protein
LNIHTSINDKGRDIAINSRVRLNSKDILIKVYAESSFGTDVLFMTVPVSASQRVTKEYLKMVGEKLLLAQT